MDPVAPEEARRGPEEQEPCRTRAVRSVRPLLGSGVAAPGERADEYEAYNYEVGIKPLIETAGRSDVPGRSRGETEFVTISYWAGIATMAAFAGPDPCVHHLERDAEFLIELPKTVQILRLLTSHGVTGSGP